MSLYKAGFELFYTATNTEALSSGAAAGVHPMVARRRELHKSEVVQQNIQKLWSELCGLLDSDGLMKDGVHGTVVTAVARRLGIFLSHGREAREFASHKWHKAAVISRITDWAGKERGDEHRITYEAFFGSVIDVLDAVSKGDGTLDSYSAGMSRSPTDGEDVAVHADLLLDYEFKAFQGLDGIVVVRENTQPDRYPHPDGHRSVYYRWGDDIEIVSSYAANIRDPWIKIEVVEGGGTVHMAPWVVLPEIEASAVYAAIQNGAQEAAALRGSQAGRDGMILKKNKVVSNL